jgi:outer membrane protein assembly factor BamB
MPVPGFDDYRCVYAPQCIDGSVVLLTPGGALAACRSSGEPLWRLSMIEPAEPLTMRVGFSATDDGHVLVQQDDLLACVATDGTPRWRDVRFGPLQFGTASSGWYWTYQSDLDVRAILGVRIDNGSIQQLCTRPRIGVVVAATAEHLIVIEGTTIVSLSRADGSEGWTLELDRPASLPLYPSGIAAQRTLRYQDLLVVPLMSYGVVGVDVARGNVVWDANLGIDDPSSLLIAGDQIHILTSQRYVRLDAARGDVLADVDTSELGLLHGLSMVHSPVASDGVIFALDWYGTIFRYDPTAHEITWVFGTDADTPPACRLRLCFGSLWTIDQRGKLYVFQLDG